MRILLHTCCAPCATYPIRALTADSHQVVAYFHNPNIHPVTEFAHRLAAFLKLAETWNTDHIVDREYGLAHFMRCVDGIEFDARRCARCYALRLGAAAERAAAEGLDAFTTTLLVSPYQKHEWIVHAGEAAAEQHGVRFHYRDFRDGFPQTREMAKALGLYRQKYCGCVFSEEERYRGGLDKLIERSRDG
jgi:predicted adenine nucleotide alpha hydrolase (AANH) superfamily ATPase